MKPLRIELTPGVSVVFDSRANVAIPTTTLEGSREAFMAFAVAIIAQVVAR